MKLIKLFQEFNLGDHVYTLHYISKLLKTNTDIYIEYYINMNYYNELLLLIDYNISNRITLISQEFYKNDGIKTWIGYNPQLKIIHNILHEDFYIMHWYWISSLLNVDNPIKTKDDFLIDFENILIPNILSDTYDFLIINSIPLSGQLNYDELRFNNIITYLNLKYKIITTKKVNNITCTLDHNLYLKDIGNISITSNNIIAVHTGPAILTINKFNINNIKSYICLNHHNYNYGYNNFKTIPNIYSLENYIHNTL